MSIPVEQKKRGRPATGVAPQIGIRLSPEVLAELDAYAAREKLTRSEVVRRLVEDGLKAKRS